ncbi:uncharacterized protein L969DRAFT_18811 [Mixia osmundae IAM 14324]|uniref:Uncharacterized protein n=1 Tax=Mixia osmundae (strain CBS 9802 / IAM 14324 / JCM 22182 / KY 12970) TaxID=764103 RepID=G7DSC5_MIXOS|nr:uncharacterized protein L969DRAFT_18811 [Mixia osmundae IAM 14324]KEI38019.1 hypothetical protein L969DRAFT_18811 [Mixia osmundae IAM 14324]GAA93485.1 hypothetical protein E5Q_00126 [Mixia osmundae IAM 14324]
MLIQRACRPRIAPPTCARHFSTTVQVPQTIIDAGWLEPVTRLANQFLLLPDALPAHPSYAALIIAVTLGLRASTGLPMLFWQRKRIARLTEHVVPAMELARRYAMTDLVAECRRKGYNHARYTAVAQSHMRKKFRELTKKHQCRRWPTLLGPLAVNLPVLLGNSAMLRQACLIAHPHGQESATSGMTELLPIITASSSPSPLATESFLSCPSLVEVDPTMLLPLCVGLLSLANVQFSGMNNRTMRAMQRLVTSKSAPSPTPAPATGRSASARRSQQSNTAPDARIARTEELQIETSKRERLTTNILSVVSLAVIYIAAQAPAAITLCWATSALFALAQNVFFGLRDRRKLHAKLYQ